MQRYESACSYGHHNRKNGEEPEENELQHQAMDDDVMHTSIELNEPLLENNVSAS